MFEFRRDSSSPRIASAISTYNFCTRNSPPVFIGNVESGGIFYAKWHISCGLFHTKPRLQIHSISDNIKRTARQKKLVGRSIFRRIWRSMKLFLYRTVYKSCIYLLLQTEEYDKRWDYTDNDTCENDLPLCTVRSDEAVERC